MTGLDTAPQIRGEISFPGADMGLPKSKTLPILLLGQNSVLLPGAKLRVPVQGRSDIPALLSAVYTRASKPRPDATTISLGCVPLNSHLLSPDGQNLLDDTEGRSQRGEDRSNVNPSRADKADLFSYGTVAKISGVQGRRSELSLIVEGVRRFRVDRIIRDKPYFEAEVTYLDEDGRWTLM